METERQSPTAVKLIYGLSRLINSVGVLLLMAIMFLLVTDVILRRFFDSPFTGTFEVVQFMLVTLVYLGVAHTAVDKAHISVDLVVDRLPKPARAVFSSATTLLSLSLMVLITWRSLVKAAELWDSRECSFLLSVPLFPFYYILACGCAVLSAVLLIQLLEALGQVGRRCRRQWVAFNYLLMAALVAVPALFAAGCFEWDVSPLATGVLGVAALLILLAAGMPIAFAMGIVGLGGFALVVGVDPALTQLETVPFGVGSDYILSVIPLFLLMGQFAFHSGLSQDLYDASYTWLGQYPGGLAMATIGGCAAFAAVSGSSVATAATMGTVAFPGMRKYNYSPRLALGSIAAGGTVGILIPPSIVFILYGILTEQSIAKLFLAGFLPGILAVALYMAAVVAQVKINPSLGPPGPRHSLGEKLLAVRKIWGMLFLFLMVIGGIYLGFFTPTEAGAVGAFGAFLMALLKSRLTWKSLHACLLETGRTTAMLIIIFVGAMIFNYFIAVTALPMDLVQLVSEQGLDRWVIMGFVLLLYLMLGCIMDPGSMIILTIPIVFPLINSLGFDPIWFGVIIVMVAEIGTITPPVGLNAFVVAGVAPDVSIEEIFKGIFPFWVADMIRLGLLTAIPAISLFLPNLLN